MKQIRLYFGQHADYETKVCTILDTMQISYRVLTDEDSAQVVGYLMNKDGFQHNTAVGAHFAMDLMLLEDVSDEEIHQFNQLSKEAKCEMKQKAMLTEHNQHWKLGDLLAEIQKEHQDFQYADQIYALLQASKELEIDAYTPDSWRVYEAAFYQAYELLQKEHTLEEMAQGYESLQAAKLALIKR